MMQFVLWLFLISEASKKNSSSQLVKNLVDDALVAAVEDTLGECSDIVETVGDFVAIFEPEGDIRRRYEEESLAVGVTKKLKTCGAILEAANTFRLYNFFVLSKGHIALRWDEVRFLNQELKRASKEMGETLFVASKDGDTAKQFHSACDAKGPTVVIIETTTGNVFGGYTDVAWSSANSAASSSNAFLFRLRPSMQRYDIKEGKKGNAIYRGKNYGPTFGSGGGHDIHIASSALSSTSSYTNGGHSYNFPSVPNYQLNDGVKNFKVKDYVVILAI